ncbi:MAG TPA: GDSL-type esterase/lipase family protein [Pirellulales bacterium]|jgi:beta-glucosidase|nr:GDSL-type esterase/lipase family protein [Pirellulales bacterium]
MKLLHRRVLLLALPISLVLLNSRFASAADDSGTATATEPAKNTAVAPVIHSGTQSRIDKISQRAKEGDVDLLFVGDSITQGWETRGKDVWEKYYGNRKAMNDGISGDCTQHVLYRHEQGNIDGIHPKLAVIMIGTNNAPGSENTAEQIADGVKAIVEQMRQKLPDAKILLMGIFPRGATSDAQLEGVVTQNGKRTVDPADMPARIAAAKEVTKVQRKKIADANAIISKLADGKLIFYIDIGDKFLEADGTLPDDIMPDHLHPNAKGYEIWAAAIEPKVSEVLGEKK